jgi:flagellar basal body P-ring formation protein FlgA
MSRRKYLGILWLIMVGMLLSPTASATDEPHENILRAATSFMEREARQAHDARFDVSVTPGRLDSRLRLRSCEEGLEAFMAPGSRTAGNSTVGVRCLGPVTWTLYVPVEISVQGEVVVLTEALPRSTVLQPSHLRLERQDVGSLSSGYLTDPDSTRGMVLRRALQAGTLLTPQMVEPPRLVQRGQRVTLLAENASVVVRVEGEALGNGARGDRVRVRNLSSDRIVEGLVLSHGTVGVSM